MEDDWQPSRANICEAFAPDVLTFYGDIGTGKHHSTSTAGKSMFEIILDPENPILVLKASGLLRAVDYEEIMPELKKLVPEPYHRGLLLDWTELDGWDEEGESLRFTARLEMRGNLERVAILADGDWDTQVTRLQEVTGLPVRLFPPSDRQSALAWLEPDS